MYKVIQAGGGCGRKLNRRSNLGLRASGIAKAKSVYKSTVGNFG